MLASRAPPVRPIETQITTGGVTWLQWTIGTVPFRVTTTFLLIFFGLMSQNAATFALFRSERSLKKLSPSRPAPQILNESHWSSTRRSSGRMRARNSSRRDDFHERLPDEYLYMRRGRGTRRSAPPLSRCLWKNARSLRPLNSGYPPARTKTERWQNHVGWMIVISRYCCK